MIVGQPWSGRTTIGVDPSGLGRWTEATISGKEARKVTVITAYRVVKISVKKRWRQNCLQTAMELAQNKRGCNTGSACTISGGYRDSNPSTG